MILMSIEGAPDLKLFFCPGCACGHQVRVSGNQKVGAVWGWNNSYDKPTFTPSIKVMLGTFPGEPIGRTCHSWVRDGQITFLSDCTHKLAGKTVPLPDMDTL